MRYHFDKPEYYQSKYGEVYQCNHGIYSRCTLFKIGNRGLAVIQQRFDQNEKKTWWSEIDPWLTDAIYLNLGFKPYFDERSDTDRNGIYPTVTVRQIMWSLKMKPIPKAPWETVFDRRNI